MRYHFHYAPQHVHDAATVLGHLLTRHRCLVSVYITNHVFDSNRELICDALRKSTNITKFELYLQPQTTKPTPTFLAALPHLKQLRELNLVGTPFENTSLEGLPEFVASARSLTTLTMPHFCVQGEDAAMIIQALKRNATIKTLSVNACLLSPVLSRCGVNLADYLSENQTLRTLSVTSCNRFSFTEVRLFIEALFRSDTISELSLIGFSLGAKNIELITRLLCQNRSVKRFHLDKCLWYDYEVKFDADDYMDSRVELGNGTSLISPWLTLLAKNKALIELTLDLSSFSPEECRSFFEALARSDSLKKVNVLDFRHKDVAEICRALRDNGVGERLLFSKYYVLHDTAQALPECKEISCINVNNLMFYGFQPLYSTLRLLPTCKHVRSLCLVMREELFSGTWSSLIANYITNTTLLRELKLEFITGSWNDVNRPERTLLEALSVNTSIQLLSIESLCFDETETQVLVDMLHSSRTVWDLTYKPEYHRWTTLFVEKLAQNVSTNYTLLSVNVFRYEELCSQLFAIADVVRRNNTLVRRAAHFVGGRRDRHCAAAVELVHFHPVLVTKVQELTSVDENEAVSLINGSLKSFTKLDDFMCVAGVVKDTVTCHRRDDGQKQLTDLNIYCWLRLRDYLKVGDVLGSL
ncbi:hypothetical protein HPB52_009195 [Rhipicephalus sanguineus]|uniref:Nlr family card domain protein n=1 Tax=Rhipicephalus sanguineus TaxID=34632 RepID=A0A9D4SR50_RHISA|nr:hypothetical protein HPB52_009195 [Rhipicephalus sanguineus]